MKVLTSAQMKAAEAGAVLSGSSYFSLMERAGLGAADAVQRLIPMEGRSCLLFCGRQNTMNTKNMPMYIRRSEIPQKKKDF